MILGNFMMFISILGKLKKKKHIFPKNLKNLNKNLNKQVKVVLTSNRYENVLLIKTITPVFIYTTSWTPGEYVRNPQTLDDLHRLIVKRSHKYLEKNLGEVIKT